MHFPTTSCDLSPVTGMTPGAGSAKGWAGSGSPVLDGWDSGAGGLMVSLADPEKLLARARP